VRPSCFGWNASSTIHPPGVTRSSNRRCTATRSEAGRCRKQRHNTSSCPQASTPQDRRVRSRLRHHAARPARAPSRCRPSTNRRSARDAPAEPARRRCAFAITRHQHPGMARPLALLLAHEGVWLGAILVARLGVALIPEVVHGASARFTIALASRLDLTHPLIRRYELTRDRRPTPRRTARQHPPRG
jgi:hypothetical protein